MASQTLSLEDVSQLLQDAGCTREFTRQFIALMETENIQSQLRLLRTQRQRQLDQLHVEEKKLDRLDDLRYVLEKQLPPADKKKLRRRL